jgi:hypothetical protein
MPEQPKEPCPPPKFVADQASMRERLEVIFEQIKATLPPNYAFFMLAVPTGELPEGQPINYISNFKRTEALNVMREFLVRGGCTDAWMKDLK